MCYAKIMSLHTAFKENNTDIVAASHTFV